MPERDLTTTIEPVAHPYSLLHHRLPACPLCPIAEASDCHKLSESSGMGHCLSNYSEKWTIIVPIRFMTLRSATQPQTFPMYKIGTHMRLITTRGQLHGSFRHLVVGITLCVLSGCSVAPKAVTVNQDTVAVQAECDESSETCKSTLGERYHYYLGLLSVYLIGL